MGVYHLMGLGRSPGVVTGPLSYLAYRYNRWNSDDEIFFAESGERVQAQAKERRGDVQAIVLFTTKEILNTKSEDCLVSSSYIQNPAGETKGPEKPGKPMRQLLPQLLRSVWPEIAGGRRKGTLFWCEVDRHDLQCAYERMVWVIAALAGTGGQGKEMWINLTGGNNVTNLALEMAAVLSGNVARSYYVQAQDENASKCVRFTSEHDYWVDLPLMPLALPEISRAILEILSQTSSIGLRDLYSRLKADSNYWFLMQDVPDEQAFKSSYLRPLWHQRLVAGDENSYTLGPRWRIVEPYEKKLNQVRKEVDEKCLTLEQLASQEAWIEKEEIEF